MVWLGEDVHSLNQVKHRSRHSASFAIERKADARAVLLLLSLLLLSLSFSLSLSLSLSLLLLLSQSFFS